ncbi:MAG: carotenoid biosynthesis protein [Chloroflexota bacterium]|nr:carotenoid biosynthesis protein [Chloroflexota bacterium]
MTASTRIARVLLACHIAALAFGLGGLLIALPHPELWADSELGRKTFDFGMEYAESLHIVFGALAMFAFGTAILGLGRTAIFFVASVGLSLGSELIGTGTGWPFGNYEYTSFLGYKVLGRVPFTIPLSWFYMGLASYLLGHLIAAGRGLRPHRAWALGLGVWFLIVWDLVLDPAMAHASMQVKFWEWNETGPYFGMPIQNYVGWAATGLAFMALSRALWRRDPDPARTPAWFPLVVYAANTAFAMALSASVDLWTPILLSALLGLAPALLAWKPGTPGPTQPGGRRQWRLATNR